MVKLVQPKEGGLEEICLLCLERGFIEYDTGPWGMSQLLVRWQKIGGKDKSGPELLLGFPWER